MEFSHCFSAKREHSEDEIDKCVLFFEEQARLTFRDGSSMVIDKFSKIFSFFNSRMAKASHFIDNPPMINKVDQKLKKALETLQIFDPLFHSSLKTDFKGIGSNLPIQNSFEKNSSFDSLKGREPKETIEVQNPSQDFLKRYRKDLDNSESFSSFGTKLSFETRSFEVKTRRINSIRWATHGFQKFISMNTEGSIVFTSIDGFAQATLSRTGLYASITFPQQLVLDKPLLVPKSSMESRKDNLSSNGTSSILKELLETLTNPIHVAQKSSMKSDLVVAYVYKKVTHRFSLFSFDPIWSYPVFILIHSLAKSFHSDKAGVPLHDGTWIHPDISPELIDAFVDLLEGKGPGAPGVIDQAFYRTNGNEVIFKLDRYETLVAQKVEAGGSKNPETLRTKEINPRTELFSLGLRPKALCFENFEAYFHKNECVLVNTLDGSALLTSNNGQFFTLYEANPGMGAPQHRTMPFNALPMVIRSRVQEGIEYSLNEIAKLVRAALKSGAIESKKSQPPKPMHGHNLTSGVSFDLVKEKKSLEEMTLIHQCRQNSADFEAFSNRRVRVRFGDRTIVTLDGMQNTATVVTKKADYLTFSLDSKPPEQVIEYLDIAFGYFSERFLGEKIITELNEDVCLQSTVQAELERTQRYLNVTRGVIPRHPIEINKEPAIPFGMSQLQETPSVKSQLADFELDFSISKEKSMKNACLPLGETTDPLNQRGNHSPIPHESFSRTLGLDSLRVELNQSPSMNTEDQFQRKLRELQEQSQKWLNETKSLLK